jgi:catechol 2,3-dioxygenase-like lactoylglutathione lyase family enzyme
MAFALDHVVIAVNDLDRAVADYQSLGFTVYPGGVHHGGVSHNALIVFEDGPAAKAFDPKLLHGADLAIVG